MTSSSLQALIVLYLLLSSFGGAYLSFRIITYSGCEPCEERVMTLKNLYPQSVFVKFDLSTNENLMRLREVTNAIDVQFLFLPVVGVFVDEKLKLIGSGDISADSWRQIIEKDVEGVPVYMDDGRGHAELKKTIEDTDRVSTLQKLLTRADVGGTPTEFSKLIVPVSLAACMDAINPCEIGVFLVLLTFVLYSVDRRTALKTGLSFTAAVFVTYLLLGLSLLRLLIHFAWTKYFFMAFAALMGALRIWESVKGERRHIPGSFSRNITRRLEQASNVKTGLAAGVVTASLLLPCSSGPYFLALSLISEGATMVEGILLLVIYNFIIIVPFMAITVLVYIFNVKTMYLRLMMTEKSRWVNLILGAGLIGLSLIIVFT